MIKAGNTCGVVLSKERRSGDTPVEARIKELGKLLREVVGKTLLAEGTLILAMIEIGATLVDPVEVANVPNESRKGTVAGPDDWLCPYLILLGSAKAWQFNLNPRLVSGVTVPKLT